MSKKAEKSLQEDFDKKPEINTQQNLKDYITQIGDKKIGPELSYLLRSRYKVIYITTNEERRVFDTFKFLALHDSYRLFQWDLVQGMVDVARKTPVSSTDNEIHKLPDAALGWIIEQARRDESKLKGSEPTDVRANVFLMFDLHHSLTNQGQAPKIERLLKQFASILSIYSIIIIGPEFKCPPGLQSEITVVDFPLPSRREVKRSLEMLCQEALVKCKDAVDWAREHEESIIDSAMGLTLTEAENALAKSIVKHRRFDIPTILEEKKQIIRKNGILEYREPRYTFDDVGGLDTLKNWLKIRKSAFSQDAVDFGIVIPKGTMLCGVPGCGKSLMAEAVASYYSVPLLRLDIGSLFNSLVGESERNTRLVIKIAETISPCVLFIDEIDKGIGNVRGNQRGDSGTTSRVFGTLLTWMQEKQKPVFVVCTGNNVTDLPPEFTRAGRFDEIFFVDLPNFEQRIEVISCLLLRKHRNPDDFDLNEISRSCEHYSPAEIEKGINNALFIAFNEGRRSLTSDDIISELAKFQPLYSSRREEIEEMREWALGADGHSGRAVLANSAHEYKPILGSSEQSRPLSI